MYARLIEPGGNWDPGIPCISLGGAPIDAPCQFGNTPRGDPCALFGPIPA